MMDAESWIHKYVILNYSFFNGINHYYFYDYILKEDLPYVIEQCFYEDYIECTKKAKEKKVARKEL